MKRAYTLVELLVCICVLSLLMGLLFPAVQAAREAARATQCKNNLHQFGLELQMRSDAEGVIPGMFAPVCDDDPRSDVICPSFAAEYPPELYEMCYYQTHSDCTPWQLTQRLELPSECIVLVHDSSFVHDGKRLALYLGGNVDVMPDY